MYFNIYSIRVYYTRMESSRFDWIIFHIEKYLQGTNNIPDTPKYERCHDSALYFTPKDGSVFIVPGAFMRSIPTPIEHTAHRIL